MAAILSNRELSETVTLILERLPPTDIAGGTVVDTAEAPAALPEGTTTPNQEPVFDPRIFED